jgi:CheY-like chemotaxis protein
MSDNVEGIVPMENTSPSVGDSAEKTSLLIVDDEEVIRSVLQHRLGQIDRLEIATAKDGRQAVEILDERMFDVVLTDIRMPGIDGLELLRRIKSRWPETAVIIMSGYADMSDTIEALRHGAVDFLQKPFELNKVVESVERVLQMKSIDYSRKEALIYLEEERRVFVIPNQLGLCPIVAAEVSKNVADKGITDVSFLESVRVALNEMLINAIEHGNLGITYDEKTRVIEEMLDYPSFVRKRAEGDGMDERKVRLDYYLDSEHVRFVITDEGDGFDHDSLPDPTNPENLLSPHGRGILITRIYMDEVTYNERGNQVTLIKRKDAS